MAGEAIAINPFFRALQESMDSNGLFNIQNDSIGVDLEQAKEAAGFTRVQPHLTFNIRGSQYSYPV